MQGARPLSVLAAQSNKTGAPLWSKAGAYRHPHAATPLRCIHVLWPAAALTHDACRRCKDELREKAGDRQWCGRRMHGRREECGSSITSVPARARAARACAAEKQAAARPHGGATRLKQRTPRACKRRAGGPSRPYQAQTERRVEAANQCVRAVDWRLSCSRPQGSTSTGMPQAIHGVRIDAIQHPHHSSTSAITHSGHAVVHRYDMRYRKPYKHAPPACPICTTWFSF